MHDAEQKKHPEIVERLESLGVEQVRDLYLAGGLPTEWNVHIREWLKSKDEGK